MIIFENIEFNPEINKFIINLIKNTDIYIFEIENNYLYENNFTLLTKYFKLISILIDNMTIKINEEGKLNLSNEIKKSKKEELIINLNIVLLILNKFLINLDFFFDFNREDFIETILINNTDINEVSKNINSTLFDFLISCLSKTFLLFQNLIHSNNFEFCKFENFQNFFVFNEFHLNLDEIFDIYKNILDLFSNYFLKNFQNPYWKWLYSSISIIISKFLENLNFLTINNYFYINDNNNNEINNNNNEEINNENIENTNINDLLNFNEELKVYFFFYKK
jgi:hypothetical protein